MIVVLHQAVGVADPMISLIDMLQHVQKVDAVLIVSENSLLFVAAGGDVIDSTCVLYAKGTRHERTLAKKRGNVKIKDLTLFGNDRRIKMGVPKEALNAFSTPGLHLGRVLIAWAISLLSFSKAWLCARSRDS
jgi:hypothetical protein